MKKTHGPVFLKDDDLANPMALPKSECPGDRQAWEVATEMIEGKPGEKWQSALKAEMSVDHLKTLISIATNAWRAKTKMVDAATGEVRDEMKRIGRHVEAIYRNLEDIGLVIRDHTNDAYDEGQPMKVVACKPTPGLDKKCVSETLLPSIFWNNRLVQNGEVEIAVPAEPNNSCKP